MNKVQMQARINELTRQVEKLFSENQQLKKAAEAGKSKSPGVSHCELSLGGNGRRTD